MTTAEPQKLGQWAEGVYFNMSFDEYLSIPCLQSSSIKSILVSETTFWVNSWMNPSRDEDDDTKAKKEGRAYHKRLLEGSAAFYQDYAEEFDCDPTTLQEMGFRYVKTNPHIAEQLVRLGQKKSFKDKAEGIARLITAAETDGDTTLFIHDVEEAKYNRAHTGKEFLTPRVISEIELAVRMIEFNPHLRGDIVGGYPEVTVLFFDNELNVWFKIRIDYLKVSQSTDLKTFANIMQKSIKRAINHAIATYQYHIQGVLYLRGEDRARQFVKNGWVYGADDVDPEWLAAFSTSKSEYFKWIFQEKGKAPTSAGRRLRRESKTHANGLAKIVEAADLFNKYKEQFGDLPWVYIRPDEDIDIEEGPEFINDL